MKKMMIGVLLVASSNLALAESPSYSYADIGYKVTDMDYSDGRAKSLNVGGSLEISDHVFISANIYKTASNSKPVKAMGYGIGVGYFDAIGDDTSWHTSLGYIRRDMEYKYYDDDIINSVVWKSGVRKNLTDTIELNAGITADWDNDYGTAITFNVGTIIAISNNIGIEIGLGFSQYSYSSINTSIRYNL